MYKPENSPKIRIGISTCLLGEKVRFDGGHKKDKYITDILAEYFEFVPVCPEVDIGLGTPRESLRLVGNPEKPDLITTKSKIDYSNKIYSYSSKKVKELSKMKLSGYILKKDSPSCGMERVRVYNDSGIPSRNGIGIFARKLIEQNPTLPIEEEGRLNDAKLRENFIVRVFCHQRLQALMGKKFKIDDIVQFHTKHKLLIMAHSEKEMRELGRIVAQAKSYEPGDLLMTYKTIFFKAMKKNSTNRKHTNVLQHIIGFFKNKIEKDDKQELLETIEDYRNGLIPLIVPLTLVRHYVKKFDINYIKEQVYLNPHPKELMLLNRV